jgi:hypothetical protein
MYCLLIFLINYFNSLPVFIPAFILIISEVPSLVKWSPFLISSATFTQSNKSLAFKPWIECWIQKV